MTVVGRAVREDVVRALNAKMKQEGIDPSQSAAVLRISDKEIAELTQIARRHAQCTDRLHRVGRGSSRGKLNFIRDHFVGDLSTGACSSSSAQAALDALRKRLESSPAGPISLHIDEPAPQGSAHALGYKLTPGKGYDGNRVHVWPGPKRFARFHRRTPAKWEENGRPTDIQAFVRQRVDRWMVSQQAWTVVPVHSRNLTWTIAVIRLAEYLSTSTPHRAS
jgi:hypothetical protein